MNASQKSVTVTLWIVMNVPECNSFMFDLGIKCAVMNEC